jgi:hypothetical protein
MNDLVYEVLFDNGCGYPDYKNCSIVIEKIESMDTGYLVNFSIPSELEFTQFYRTDLQ